VVEAMSRINERPILFALSNPVEKHECLPEDAYAWSIGKAVHAGGVQFPPVHLKGQTLLPSQADNLYIFPAVGLAIYLTRPQRATDEMFIEAAKGLAGQVSPEQLKLGILYPPHARGQPRANRGCAGSPVMIEQVRNQSSVAGSFHPSQRPAKTNGRSSIIPIAKGILVPPIVRHS
jgi:malic enzyme